MTYRRGFLGLLLLMAVVAVAVGSKKNADKPKEKNIKRVGMVVGVKEDQLAEYKRLHADNHAGVRDLLSKYHMENFSIFLQKMPDGKYYEFGYYEYTGDDFKGDMAKMDKEKRIIEWLKVCDPMQTPLPGAESWTEMECVYFNK